MFTIFLNSSNTIETGDQFITLLDITAWSCLIKPWNNLKNSWGNQKMNPPSQRSETIWTDPWVGLEEWESLHGIRSGLPANSSRNWMQRRSQCLRLQVCRGWSEQQEPGIWPFQVLFATEGQGTSLQWCDLWCWMEEAYHGVRRTASCLEKLLFLRFSNLRSRVRIMYWIIIHDFNLSLWPSLGKPSKDNECSPNEAFLREQHDIEI